MKRFATLWTAAGVLCAALLYAQADWVWQSPLPQGNHLNDVRVFGRDKAICIGDKGTYMKTPDGGETWDIRPGLNGSADDLFSIYFINDSTGWIAGEIGTLLKTTDGGENWTARNAGTDVDLNDVTFADPKNGWIVGRWGRILHTSDGGAVWKEQNSSTYRNLRSVFFIDSLTGWLAGHGGTLLKTENGGENWTEQDGRTQSNLWSVFFLNPDTGWVAGQDGVILKTVNGGHGWVPQSGGAAYDFSSIRFLDPDTGIATGFSGYLNDYGILQKQSGVIFRTTDGGESWAQVNPSSVSALNAAGLDGSGNGLAVGTTGTMLQTTDFGAVWERRSKGTGATLTTVFFLDPDTGWAAGSGQMLKTTDGGENWAVHPQKLPGDARSDYYAFQALQFVNADTGTVTGSYYLQTSQSLEMTSVILRTNDGGTTWSTARRQDYEYLFDMQMIDPDTGYAIGGVVDFVAGAFKPSLIKTTDGGADWQPVNAKFSGVLFYSIDFIDAKTGWAAGQSSSIYKTTDGGLTWKGYRTGQNDVTYQSVDFCDAQRGWAVGTNGAIVRSDNGGETWKRQVSGTRESLAALFIVDYKTAWATGTNGVLLNTLDAGETWPRSETHTQNALLGVCFPTFSTGWVVGENGSILKTTNGRTPVRDASDIAAGQPDGRPLLENYPNPFNPETTLRFTLPKADEVTLKVYDLLGREVAAPAKGRFDAGTHRITFRADNLPSGVYLCRLKTTNSTLTRKLVIQK